MKKEKTYYCKKCDLNLSEEYIFTYFDKEKIFLKCVYCGNKLVELKEVKK